MKELLLSHGGIRSADKKLVDGNVHTLFFKVRTPQQLMAFSGAERRIKDNEEGDLQRDKLRAEFIQASMCNEDGTPLFTAEEAMRIPITLKPELCQMILEGSNTPGEAGKR